MNLSRPAGYIAEISGGLLCRFLPRSGLLLLLIGLSACLPTSEHPIDTASDVLPSLFSGIWEGELTDGPATLAFLASGEGTSQASVQGLLIRHRADRPSINEGWLAFEADIASFRGEIFASLKLRQMDGKTVSDGEDGYYLFRIVGSETSFKAVGMNDLVLTELINRGALEGHIDKSATVPRIRLTETARALRAFLVTADLDELFSDPFAHFARR